MAGSKMERIRGIAKSLFTQSSRRASAATLPEDVMESRKRRLDSIGGRKMGGMFDIIFKKRKERENSLRGIDY